MLTRPVAPLEIHSLAVDAPTALGCFGTRWASILQEIARALLMTQRLRNHDRPVARRALSHCFHVLLLLLSAHTLVGIDQAKGTYTSLLDLRSLKLLVQACL